MRYYDELPRAAQTAFRNAVGNVRNENYECLIREAFQSLGVDVKRLEHLVYTTVLVDRVLYALAPLGVDEGKTIARILFGTASERDVLSLACDVFEETETLNKGRQQRIADRIAAGTQTPADIDWIRGRAEALTDDQLLEMRPFDGDESDAEELSRKVVRGRVPHTCHWTQQTIRPGERHLVIKEVVEGEFLTTRHSLLSVYLDVVGEHPGLAGHLAPKPENEVAA